MHSFTEENYLKAIFKLSDGSRDTVTTNAIAELLRTKAASVTDMLKKLAAKKLIHYKKYQGVSLSPAGRKIALRVIRKHRLWELFLKEKLQFGWDEVHEIAEQLEHIQSAELIERLDKFLGYPTHDPHGDPIPDRDGQLTPSASRRLSQVQVGESVIMTGVTDHTPAFLRYLDKQAFRIGQSLEVKEINEFDRSMTLKGKAGSVQVSRDAAENILVQ